MKPLQCRRPTCVDSIDHAQSQSHPITHIRDRATRALHAHILSAAAVPYLASLRSWINYGEINDPYEEFMVAERKSVTKENIRDDFNDVYWEQRYSLRQEAIPSFLYVLGDKVLLAGKYLNVIRECGIEIKLPNQVVDESGELINRGSVSSGIVMSDVVKAIEGGRYAESKRQTCHFRR